MKLLFVLLAITSGLFMVPAAADTRITILSGVKQLPNDFQDKIATQPTIGVQLEMRNVNDSVMVISLLYSRKHAGLGTIQGINQNSLVTTTELRIGSRWYWNYMYFDMGPAIIMTDKKARIAFKNSNENIWTPDDQADYEIGFGGYLAVGAQWKISKAIHTGVQYGMSRSLLDNGGRLGVGKQILVGTLSYQF